MDAQGGNSHVNGAQIAIEALRREGVTHVFGLPGTTIMHLIDAVGTRSDMRYISVRHEQVAAFMADGYTRGGGGIGVCMASRGPGAANMAIGLHNAHAESIPVLALVGQVSDEIVHREAFEEMDVVRFFEPITKWALEPHRTERIPELIQRAVRTALSGRPGPVMVSLPLDVQTKEAEVCYSTAFRPSAPAPVEADVTAAVERLATARRPVILAGGGFRGPGYDPAVAKLAERLHVPVVTTWLRKNVFPNDSALFCGSLGYGAVPVTDDLIRGADVLLALGARFSEFTTKRWTLLDAGTTLIHVDLDPNALGRYYVPEIGICADVSTATAALLAAADAAGPPEGVLMERSAWVAEVRAAYLEQTRLPDPGRTSPVSTGGIISALRTVLPRSGAVLVQDAPSLGTWIHRYLDFTTPDTFYAAGGGSMGWGLPAAMGIKLARPNDPVVTVNGDGSFWMVAQDLETAVREKIPVVNLINNNFSFGNTRDRQRTAHGGRFHGVFYGNPDFAAFARLLGAHGERVERDADLVPALDRALESGLPAVIDCVQDSDEGLPADLVPLPAK
jgi:acetolactate synthase-1/2/3 large subunit